MTTKRTKVRHDKGKEPVKILIQRVEFDENGQPVVVHDCISLEPALTHIPKKEGNHEENH